MILRSKVVLQATVCCRIDSRHRPDPSCRGGRRYMLTKIRRSLKNEQGAEMVEWVVVVVVLAVVASIVFGPNGVLMNAVKDGINKISAIISALPTT